MGLSLGDLVKGIAGVIPGGGAVASAIGGISAIRGLLPGGGGNTSSLGRYEVLVPDPVERMIGTMPAQTSQPCPSIPVVMAPVARTVMSAPNRSYVIVECPPGSGIKQAMIKPVARALGLWKPRKKPPIKVSDWTALMKADRTIKKLKMVEKRAGMVQRARGRKTTTTRTRRK